MSDRPLSLRTRLQDHPILVAVGVAAALRAVAATACDGWFASDDYAYVIEPAWRWLTEPGAAFPSHYRSPLLARGVAGVFRLAEGLGLEASTSGLHLAYLLFGLWSLLAIPAVFRLARARLGEAAARQAIWLMAAQVIMPTISTRALIEVACIPPLVWGLAWADGAARSRRPLALGLLGGLGVGLAALVRFQVGLVFPVLLGWQVVEVARQRGDWRVPAGFAGGGVVATLTQGLVDASLGRPFLGTPFAYLDFNLEHASGFGTSPWYNYGLQLLVLTVPPVTLWLARPFWRACLRHGAVSLTLAAFLAVHSLIGHKEDRFLFPVLPLFFILLGAALAELRVGAKGPRAAWLCFWGVNVVALALAVTGDSQRAVTASLLAIREQGGTPHVALVRFRDVPAFYLGHGPTWIAYRDVDSFLDAVEAGGERPEFVLSRLPLDEGCLARLEVAGLWCGKPIEFAGDLVDQLLLAVNAEHNRRRGPTTLWRCQESRAP